MPGHVLGLPTTTTSAAGCLTCVTPLPRQSTVCAARVTLSVSVLFVCVPSQRAHAEDANNELQGDTYLYLAQLDNNASHTSSVRHVLDWQVHNSSVSYWFWIDAVFMAMPTFAHMTASTGDAAYSTKAWAIFNHTASAIPLWSPRYSLFSRDASYLNKTSPNGKPVFWGRGNGWAVAALARTMEQLATVPNIGNNAAMHDDLQTYFVAMAAAIAKLQQSDGMWRADLLDAAHYPNPETTGTALFTYALAWGVRHGVLDATTYQPVVAAAWKGLSTVALQPGGLVGWCQSVGAAPGPATASSTSDFCVGQFLMAASEVLQLAAATCL